MVALSFKYNPPEEDDSTGKIRNWSRVKETPYQYEWSHDIQDRLSVAVMHHPDEQGEYKVQIFLDNQELKRIFVSFMDDRYSDTNKEDMRRATAQWLKRHPLNDPETGNWEKRDSDGTLTNLPSWRNNVTGSVVMYAASEKAFYFDSGGEGGLFDPILDGYEATKSKYRNEWMRNHPYA
jgi:hypothetical protein